ncbi:MAG TPA: inositol monophosphatase family protein, partial [Actinomycetota bacterium]|nr:inositol monophosphatase family protein [Actinomycetota bacterium]
GESPVLGDVDDGLVLELKTGSMFRARRGAGTSFVIAGESRSPAPSAATGLDGAFWTYGLRGRPTMPSAIVLEELIDRTGVSSGTFDLGSAAFGMTRVATGQLDAYVDHGQRLIDDLPQTRELFERIAGGAVLNNSPYDVAAALLICTESGCTVTDAGGRPLEGRALVGSGPDEQLSTLAAGTPELHAQILQALDRGIDRLRAAMHQGRGSARPIG